MEIFGSFVRYEVPQLEPELLCELGGQCHRSDNLKVPSRVRIKRNLAEDSLWLPSVDIFHQLA